MGGLKRILLIGVVLAVSTAVLWLTRRRGWAEIRALCIALPLGFLLGRIAIVSPAERAFEGGAWCAIWSGIARADSALCWDGLALGAGTAAVIWALIMLSYIGFRAVKR